ncbi:hypothetical protein EV401DRAFT_1184783 [Pisolithus croceorrhizus]|nr:hypothetical protein EV401DRAFT_1184783 [Pisolithus croceorrhizus]
MWVDEAQFLVTFTGFPSLRVAVAADSIFMRTRTAKHSTHSASDNYARQELSEDDCEEVVLQLQRPAVLGYWQVKTRGRGKNEVRLFLDFRSCCAHLCSNTWPAIDAITRHEHSYCAEVLFAVSSSHPGVAAMYHEMVASAVTPADILQLESDISKLGITVDESRAVCDQLETFPHRCGSSSFISGGR